MAEPTRNFGFADLLDQEVDPSDVAQLLDLPEEKPEPGTREGAVVPGDGKAYDYQISPEDKKRLAGELCDILTEHDSMMSEKWARDQKIEDQYALMEDTTKVGVYPGAAQMVSEMLMSAVDQAKARIVSTILGVTPIVKVDPIETSSFSGSLALETAKAAEDFLDNYSKDVIGIENLLDLIGLRCTKVGTTVLYVNWRKSSEKYKSYGQSGKIIETERDTSRVCTDVIRNQDIILWPPWIQDWQEEYEIVGHRVQKTISQWRVEAKRLGLTDDLRERVEKFSLGTQVTEDRDQAMRREGIDPKTVDPGKGFVEYAELWCNRILPGEEMPEKYQLFLHEGLRELLWIDHNRLHSQKHPYFPIRYKRVDGSAWGMGLGHEIAYCQAADSAFRNLELDNLMATAFSMVLLKQGTMADAIMDRAYPGMRVPTEDPSGDINVVSLASKGAEALQLLYMAMGQNEARKTNASGLAQVLQGMGDPTLKSGAGTGSTMALIEQAGKKFGDVDRQVRSDLTPIYAMFLDLVAQFAAEGVFYTKTSDENAMLLKQLQYIPIQGVVSNYFRIRAHAPSASNNKELTKQTTLMVDQFTMQRIQMMVGLAMQYYPATNPAGLPQFLFDSIEALRAMGEQVLEVQELPGVKGILPAVTPPTPEQEQINQLNEQVQGLSGQLQQAQQAAQPPTGPPQGPPGMPPGMPPEAGQMPMPGMG